MEVRKRGMDTIPHYPRRAAGDFANSTWPEAKNRYAHVTFRKDLSTSNIHILFNTKHFVGKGRLISSDGPVQFSCTNWSSREDPQ